jgi:hypothetical protein
MPLAIMAGTAVAGAGATAYAGNQSANATDKASERATGFQRDALAQQTALSAPYRAFGESGVSKLSRLLGLTDPTSPAARSNLVPLPGITLTGVHSPKTERSTLGSILDPAGLNLPGPLAEKTSGGGSGGITGGLFFDRTTGRIVDRNGSVVLDAGAEGIIPGAVHGYNNQVRRDAQGNLFSVGSKGENPLNINLTKLTPEELAAQGPQTGAAGTNQILDELRNMPGYQFKLREGTRAAKNAASASGLTLSGNTLRGIEEFGTGLADSTYQSEVNNLMGVTGLGQAAAAGQAANIGQANSNLGNLAINQGNTQAGIATNTIAGITGALSNAANQYYSMQTLQGLMQPGGSSLAASPAATGSGLSPAVWNSGWSGP